MWKILATIGGVLLGLISLVCGLLVAGMAGSTQREKGPLSDWDESRELASQPVFLILLAVGLASAFGAFWLLR